jgi:hypothetical protein
MRERRPPVNEPLPERSRFSLHPGVSILILLFLILGLVSFGALSLSTASADKKLSDKASVQTVSYYAARNEEQQWLCDEDQVFRSAYETRKKSTASADDASDAYFQAAGASGQDHIIRRTFAVGSTQVLSCELEVLLPESGDGPFYRIRSEKIVYTGSDAYDNSITVLDPSAGS